jgi:hypothetical protein
MKQMNRAVPTMKIQNKREFLSFFPGVILKELRNKLSSSTSRLLVESDESDPTGIKNKFSVYLTKSHLIINFRNPHGYFYEYRLH